MIDGGMTNLIDKLRIINTKLDIIIAKLDALEGRVDITTCSHQDCSHQGRVHMDYVFNGEDEVQVYTCDICGDEV